MAIKERSFFAKMTSFVQHNYFWSYWLHAYSSSLFLPVSIAHLAGRDHIFFSLVYNHLL